MESFWQKLNKPFTVLAPMDGVTDPSFRKIICQIGRPDVFFTEFANASAIVRNVKPETDKLKFCQIEHPIVAQIWGTNLADLETSAQIVSGLGFDGIDINMGCPVKDVVKSGGGAGTIKIGRETVKQIVQAVKKGAGKLPVSVKTRLGFDKTDYDWIEFLLNLKLPAITIHGRTAKQMSRGLADWEEIKRVVELKNKINPETIIIGNGDVENLKRVGECHKNFGVDGVMIGRGILANPFLFNLKPQAITKESGLKLALQHLKNSDKPFPVMKKYFKIYISGFTGAKEIRNQLMAVDSAQEAETILDRSAR